MWQDRRSSIEEEENKPKPFNASTFTPDSEAQRDRARIIHSSSFRRLQAKTQVLGIGESDFYRTRLTHSLEVAQIGSSICEQLRTKYIAHQDYVEHLPTFSQIEAICLAHDIGHPPFGHGGEVALNFYMHDKGGFEGNGQTLRIVSKLGEYSPNHGLDLTRRTMLGLLKYPICHKDVKNYASMCSCKKNINIDIDLYKPPKCIHDDDKDVLEWIISKFDKEDIEKFQSIEEKEGKIKSKFKSFDTSIMELADDISYGVHDLEDALALQLVTQQQWKKEILENHDELEIETPISVDKEFYTDKLFSPSNKERKHAISRLVRYFVESLEITEEKEFKFINPLLRYQATISGDAKVLLTLLKNFVMDHVIKKPEVRILEYKGQQMILRIFEVLLENPEKLLPKSTYNKYLNSRIKERVICDYISGMTDNYAVKLYHRLFSPETNVIKLRD